MKLFLVIAATLAVAAAGTVDPAFLRKIKSGKSVSAILELPSVMDQVESSVSLKSLSGDAKVSALVSMLEGLTSAAQAPFVTLLNNHGVNAEQYWAANIIRIKDISLNTVSLLAAAEGDFFLREEHTASINPAIELTPVNITQNVQWGVEKIRAPAAWAVTEGEGVVVGVIDTGCNVGHVALADAYAGAWRDPYYNTAGPTDQHGHGSHCMGTILGRANGVGVAPKATWVACRGLNHQGSGTEGDLTTCAQFMVTANPRPSVVSNSWGGGQGQTWYNSQVSAWRNAGIVPVFAIGNAGSSCRTANSPGDQPNLISVGSTTTTDAMSSFSSRGAATSGAMKPEVSAPGSNIVSCGTGSNNYATMSGTSMATPHVAGAVALILSAHRDYTYDQVLRALQTTANHPSLSNADRNCGTSGGNDFPNNAFGHGRIDVGAALGK